MTKEERKKLKVGDLVNFRTYSNQVVTGEVIEINKGWFSETYLLEWGIKDEHIEYKKAGWINKSRLLYKV